MIIINILHSYAATISTMPIEALNYYYTHLEYLNVRFVDVPYVRFRLLLSQHALRGLQYIIDKEKKQGERNNNRAGTEAHARVIARTLHDPSADNKVKRHSRCFLDIKQLYALFSAFRSVCGKRFVAKS